MSHFSVGGATVDAGLVSVLSPFDSSVVSVFVSVFCANAGDGAIVVPIKAPRNAAANTTEASEAGAFDVFMNVSLSAIGSLSAIRSDLVRRTAACPSSSTKCYTEQGSLGQVGQTYARPLMKRT